MKLPDPLTPTELDVLTELVVGPDRRNEAIAKRLHVSVNTIKSHMASILDKTGTGNRVRLAVWAMRLLDQKEKWTIVQREAERHADSERLLQVRQFLSVVRKPKNKSGEDRRRLVGSAQRRGSRPYGRPHLRTSAPRKRSAGSKV